jgi:nitroreductase
VGVRHTYAMNRRTVIVGLGAGVAAAASGAGLALWRGAGADEWAAEAAAIRRPWSADLAGREDALRELVRYGTLAANSHNTQPWRFTLSENTISIAPDLSRRTPAVDPDDHHLFASLGCAAENVVQAAPLTGLVASLSSDIGGEHPGITIGFQKSAATPSALADAIPKRQCTRSTYDGRMPPLDDLRALEEAGRGEGVEMLLITEPRKVEDILAFIAEGNTRQIADPAFVAELKRWVRFSYGEALATRDGLFARAAGNPALPAPVGRLLFDQVFSAESENEKITAQMRSSAGLAIFVSERNDKRHWIEAGRSCQRFALQATALGIKYAFLNQPVEVAEVRDSLAAHLGIGDRRPDLVVRFGYAPNMPWSLRRRAAEVLV